VWLAANLLRLRLDFAANYTKLTKYFKSLTSNSPCKDGTDVCIEDQCVNGKFILTSCSEGLKCVVIPLVNKQGTSITCSTEKDRLNRLANARSERLNVKRRKVK
jgi:hypothetical protein